MKIRRMKVTAADTTKKDYIVEVTNLLRNHDDSDHNKNQFESYTGRAHELLKGNTDEERRAALLLST